MPGVWFHLVIVIHGLAEGEGFSVHLDRAFVAQDNTLSRDNFSATSAPSMVMGQGGGSGVALDELLIWLTELSQVQVHMLYDSYQTSNDV